ncbi:MAG: DUF2079 domain-containing protein, partial [Actinomycetota bacterium]|nr:DUF2079 domain-containing protein [Actinomycetota bacterium]
YAATMIPAFFAAAVFGVARIGSRAAYLVLAASVIGAVALGPLGRVDIDSGEHDATQRRAIAGIPTDAAVSATNALGAHLSDRRRIFSFPVLREADWVAVDTERLTFLDSLEPGRSEAALAALRRDPRWLQVFAEDGVLVLKRR